MKKASFGMALAAFILALSGLIIYTILMAVSAVSLVGTFLEMNFSLLLGILIFAILCELAIGIPIVVYAKKSTSKNEKHMGMGVFAIVIGGLIVFATLGSYGLSLIPSVLYILAGVGMVLNPTVAQPNFNSAPELNSENSK